MNYEDYIGNVTTANIQTTQENWSDYFKQQNSPVKPGNTYGPKPTGRKRTAASYMDMGPEVYERPSHEAQLQQQINKMQQQRVESRLAKQMKEYNQSYMKKMEALDNATKKQDDKIVSVNPVDPGTEPKKENKKPEAKKEYVAPKVIVKDEPVKKEPVLEAPAPVIEEPVIEEQKQKEPEKVEIKLFPDEIEEDEEEQIPGISFDEPEAEPIKEPVEEQITEDIVDQEPPEMEFIEAGDDMFSGLTPEMLDKATEEEPEETEFEQSEEDGLVELDGDNIIVEEKPKPTKKVATKKKQSTKKTTTAKEKSTPKAKKKTTKKSKE